jgi:hypothetical protein
VKEGKHCRLERDSASATLSGMADESRTQRSTVRLPRAGAPMSAAALEARLYGSVAHRNVRLSSASPMLPAAAGSGATSTDVLPHYTKSLVPRSKPAAAAKSIKKNPLGKSLLGRRMAGSASAPVLPQVGHVMREGEVGSDCRCVEVSWFLPPSPFARPPRLRCNGN